MFACVKLLLLYRYELAMKNIKKNSATPENRSIMIKYFRNLPRHLDLVACITTIYEVFIVCSELALDSNSLYSSFSILFNL